MEYPQFIRINNKDAFLVKEFPKYHPSSMKYISYWRKQKKYCIEGLWAQDTKDPDEEGMWRWMPGNLYFYVNMGTILHRERKGEPRKKIRPYLRDVEWEFFYNWIVCRGFSGFDNDDEYHCIRDRVAMIGDNDNKKPKYTEESFQEYWTTLCKDKDGNIDERTYYNYFKKDGTPKKYMDAKEYVRRLYDKPMGRALFSNDALNLFMLGSRGFGKSYMVGVGVILHEWLFDGAKYYDSNVQYAGTVDVFVGAAMASKSSDILDKTLVAFHNLPGSWGKYENYTQPPFYKKTKGSLKPNNMKSPFRHEYDVKVQTDTGTETQLRGSRSSIRHGVYTAENPEAAAGGRYTVMAIEEVGLMSNLLTVHGSNDAAQTIGDDILGSSVYLGTGGNIEKIVESEIIFRDPEGFRFLPFENTYEPSDGSRIGWFVPAIYNVNSLKDENGNTDIQKAIDYYNERRDEKKRSKDRSALALEMMNYPLVPSEMFLNAGNNIFPISDLKAQLSYVVNNPSKYENLNQVGKMMMDPDTKKPVFKRLTQVDVEEGWGEIKRFPLSDNKGKPGAVVIREHPVTDSSGNIPYGRYLQGTDTYDDDESTTNSFGSTFILDTFTNRIVAEYFGRVSTNEFYETCRRLNIYYNTIHNYENNKKGLFTYYRNKNCTHLLADTPESLRNIENITISKVGNKQKGTPATKAVNQYARELVVSYLLENAPGEDEEGLMNLHNLWGEGALREMIYWTYEGNYDRVSALGMLMILKADREQIIEQSRLKGIEKARSIYEHSFWTRNYDSDKSRYSGQLDRARKLF